MIRSTATQRGVDQSARGDPTSDQRIAVGDAAAHPSDDRDCAAYRSPRSGAALTFARSPCPAIIVLLTAFAGCDDVHRVRVDRGFRFTGSTNALAIYRDPNLV